MQIKTKKIVAMTLIEVLSVLAIMGTITALTLPGLKKHSQKVENAKLAQQTYNLLEQAIDMETLASDSNIDDWANTAGSLVLKDNLLKYFTTVKDCTAEYKSSSDCFVPYREFKESKEQSPNVRSFILPNGTVLAGQANRVPARFIIDVNNINPPNMEGVDVFIFDFAKYNQNCESSNSGQWKFCPHKHSKELIEDGWNITYW